MHASLSPTTYLVYGKASRHERSLALPTFLHHRQMQALWAVVDQEGMTCSGMLTT